MGHGKVYFPGGAFICTDNLNITFDDDGTIPDYVRDINFLSPDSAEFSCECEVNPQLFAKLTGVDLARGLDLASSFYIECSAPYEVQKRRHKKKRINKKWAKRYGYRTKFAKVELKEVSLVDKHLCDDVHEFEFVGRRWGDGLLV